MQPLKLAAFLALLLSSTPTTASSVTELDSSTLWTLISNSPDRDVLIFFVGSHAAAAPLRAHTEALARRLGLGAAPAFSLALYDVHLHGWPAGLHVHLDADGDSAVILFPAGGREPSVYDFAHDPLSYPLAESQGAADGGEQGRGSKGEETEEGEVGAAGEHHRSHDSHHHHHHHGHSHALAPTLAGTLRWLRAHSSYPSEVPQVGLSEIWEGREDGLFTAVLTGLEALHKRMEALQKENAALTAELAACKKE